MTYNVMCSCCGFKEEWSFITLKEYENRKKKYECPNCKKKGTMANCFDIAVPVQYKGVGWTGAGLGGGHDWRSKLDKELAINDQLSNRNDEGYRKATEKVKRAEDKANKNMDGYNV